MKRIILHVDLDSFYAAVEERRNPSLKGKPVVICMYSGRKDSGAVATANYEARKLGIRSGLPLRTARARATKETVFLPADRGLYKKISDRIMKIFRRHADAFEQRSIDEAYLDVSRTRSYKKASDVAKKIKEEVLRKEELTCSVGIGPNKLTAKMASREKKPNGLTLVRDFQKAFSRKPVEKLFGIGPKTLEVLKKHKITTISDLAAFDKETLKKEFGERKGHLLHEHARGRDDEEVEELIKKQLSRMGTLPEDTKQFKTIAKKLSSLAEDLFKKIKKEKAHFRTISLLTVNTFLDMKTRSITLESSSRKKEDILENAESLLKGFLKENPTEVLRRIGVKVSSLTFLEEKKKQKSLTEF